MAPVLEELGYHIVCIQEARLEKLSQINSEKWSWSLKCQQFVAARLPPRVEVHAGQDLKGEIRWSVFTVHFTPPGGPSTLWRLVAALEQRPCEEAGCRP